MVGNVCPEFGLDKKEGAQATAFGFVSKNSSDGSPRSDKFYGDGQAGIGGPGADEFTQKKQLDTQ